jgi:flagellar protein FliO/FliZ
MDTNAIGMGDSSMEIFRMLISLALVIGLVFVAYYWLKRRGNMPGLGQKRMRVVERLAVDTRRSILLVEVDGQEMLIGVGNDTISPIKTLKQGPGNEA